MPVQVSSTQLQVLRQTLGGFARSSAVRVHVLRAIASTSTAVTVKSWNGTAFVDSQVKSWNGTAFVDALAVKSWNGSTFV